MLSHKMLERLETISFSLSDIDDSLMLSKLLQLAFLGEKLRRIKDFGFSFDGKISKKNIQ